MQDNQEIKNLEYFKKKLKDMIDSFDDIINVNFEEKWFCSRRLQIIY